MSILIKGMEMPANCSECRFVDVRYGFCYPSNTSVRPTWCPLIEVPTPHGRLVVDGYAVGVVDGEKIKADTWYEYKDGKLAEV